MHKTDGIHATFRRDSSAEASPSSAQPSESLSKRCYVTSLISKTGRNLLHLRKVRLLVATT
eukprot:4308941-Pleurochrysis_carterae.AAC.2